jgi:hypothetical protein
MPKISFDVRPVLITVTGNRSLTPEVQLRGYLTKCGGVAAATTTPRHARRSLLTQRAAAILSRPNGTGFIATSAGGRAHVALQRISPRATATHRAPP